MGRINLFFLFFHFFFIGGIYSQSDTSVTFSEIMFYPSAPNSEFVELFNTSDSSSIDLSGWKIRYAGSSPDEIVPLTDTTILEPGAYAVILEGDYDIFNGIYSGLIPEEALVLKIDNNAFGSSGMSNSGDRIVFLINPEGDTLEYYIYSADNQGGFSDEKILMNRINHQSNWSNSVSFNGTPGSPNSVSPKNYNLQLSELRAESDSVFAGDTIRIELRIKNIGLRSAGNFHAELFEDSNHDSTAQSNELIFSEFLSYLPADDSADIEFNFTAEQPGRKLFIGCINYPEDEDTSDNTALRGIHVMPLPNSPGDAVVNEIMYDPGGDEPEWLEIYNNTGTELDLNGWKIADRTRGVLISDSTLPLSAGDFILLCEEESIHNYYSIPSAVRIINLPSLNNSGDEILLTDHSGRTIDSVDYKPEWGGGGGRSLERKDPAAPSNNAQNWSSPYGMISSTPGFINSVSQKRHDLCIDRFICRSSYAVIGYDAVFEIWIKNLGSLPAEEYSLNVYLDTNLDSTAQQGEFITSIEGGIIAPGTTMDTLYSLNVFAEGQNRLICIIDFYEDEFRYNDTALTDFRGVMINEEPGDLVINEIMYAPVAPEPEWLELYNKSQKTISLKNYRLSDIGDTSAAIESGGIIYPSEYVVLAKDSIIMSIYDISSSVCVIPFPVLNNSGDKILLIDSLNRVIDSVEYRSEWGGGSGRSLERVDPFSNICAPENWKSSSAARGATPGKINSNTEKEHDLAAGNLYFFPEFPFGHDTVNITALIINKGMSREIFDLMLYEDTDRDSIGDKYIETIYSLNLQAKDSMEIRFNYEIHDLLSDRAFEALCRCTGDQDTSNNSIYGSVKPGHPPGSVIINEIMYRPAGGEPEWVELFNRTAEDVDLKDYSISDVITNPLSTSVSEEELLIKSHDYLVICKDSSIFEFHRSIGAPVRMVKFANLNNDADGVVIRDWRGITIDSVLYSSQWGGNIGYSIERISPESVSLSRSNWSPSVDIEQSTPGRINSVTPRKYDILIRSLSAFPPDPSPGDSVSLRVLIVNNGLNGADGYRSNFFLLREGGALSLGTISGDLLAPGDSSVIYSPEAFLLEGETEVSSRIDFEADEDTINNYLTRRIIPGYKPGAIAINEIMYHPLSDRSEWIELVNVSDSSVNIKNWEVTDLLGSAKKSIISHSDLILAPGNFLLLASDSSSLHFDRSNINIVEVDFGSLGNSSDGIVLYDFRFAVIDSLFYFDSWGGEKGYSLERWNAAEETNDSSNWRTTLSRSGGTPGSPNSVLSVAAYSESDVIINEIMYEPAEGNSEFIELYNRSDNNVNLGGWRLRGKNKENPVSRFFLELPPGQFILISSDSAIYDHFPGLRHEGNVVISELSLSNSGNPISLKDIFGNTVDSTAYTPDWHNPSIPNTKNKSLERINPNINSNLRENWSTSTDLFGSTPCRPNSILMHSSEGATEITIEPNPFSPDNDGFEDFAVISYSLTQSTSRIRIRIYDSEGRLVRTITDNQPSGSRREIVFDGRDDSGRALRIGIYVLLLEAVNSANGIIDIRKIPLVIARKL